MARRLLIVDNDDEQRGDIQAAAKRAGFAQRDIAVVDNEEEARRLIMEDRFDIAVIDISLTRGNCEGLEVIKQLRLHQPRCWIAGLTSHMHDFGAEVLDHGGDDFVYTEWASINWEDLLVNRLAMWRKARPRTFAVG
jgi:DNA-binding response OmpR family regulator